MLTINEPIHFIGEVKPIDHDVARINLIDGLYKNERQLSKAPTFALTYQGTWKTLVKNCGFTDTMAKKIEASYHDLYVVSTQWVQAKLDEAAKKG